MTRSRMDQRPYEAGVLTIRSIRSSLALMNHDSCLIKSHHGTGTQYYRRLEAWSKDGATSTESRRGAATRRRARAPGRPGDLWHLMILCSQESSQVPTIKCLKVPDQDGGEYTDGASSAVGSRLGSPESTPVGARPVDAPLTPPPLSLHASARTDAKAASRPDCDPTGADRSRPDVSRPDCDRTASPLLPVTKHTRRSRRTMNYITHRVTHLCPI